MPAFSDAMSVRSAFHCTAEYAGSAKCLGVLSRTLRETCADDIARMPILREFVYAFGGNEDSDTYGRTCEKFDTKA